MSRRFYCSSSRSYCASFRAAPAAYDTISAYFRDTSAVPDDYDLILTGDLGRIGSRILCDAFADDGVDLSAVYRDCGCMIFDSDTQDVHAGGSGCGCGASVLCGFVLNGMLTGQWKRILFCATGALMSPLTVQQGESIPAICHLVEICMPEGDAG